MLHEGWHWEVSSANGSVLMSLWYFWEVLDGDELHGLSEEPVDLHWPEWEDVDVVHQRVWMRHLSFLNINL
jgi:hypothetical protein